MKRCAICQIHSTRVLCTGCQSLIPTIEYPCQQCAKPLNQSHGLCGECRSDPPAFAQTWAATTYQPPASHWVQQLKFGGRLDRANIMAEALAVQLVNTPLSIPVVPVPLHRKRLLHRGYNQAFEVARLLCKLQTRPLWDDLLLRRKDTAMQAELPEKQRAANVRQAFSLNEKSRHSVTDKTVLLLDDVMTTGQTLRAAAKCLKLAGADTVMLAVFARSGG